MSLTPGTRLGVYEVTTQIGEGGMGEVYQATDTSLKRSVAIKVLPALVAGDADRLARFQREAEVLAALNHPNIAAIYGLEKTPDFTALVMELVEGEDLSQRIARGAIPLDDALPMARQIADALEAAHEQGIVHRDLKPANIKVRADGTVKVLDFGLAKAMDPAGASSANAMNSPTLTARATQMGMIIGTAAYMAPEQAKGKSVDRRADIWAFGVVLYEMLTARRLFDAEDISETLAAVLTRDVSLTSLPANIPPRLRVLLRDCLVRDPKQRLRDIGHARIEIARIEAGTPDEAVAPASASAAVAPLWRRIGIPAGAALVASAVVGAVVWVVAQSAVPAPRLVRFELPLPAAETLSIASNDHDLAISPDGTRVVYRVAAGGQTFLAVRAMDELTARPLRGLPQAVFNPFVSPDGAWVGFSDEGDGSLKKVSILGGPAVPVCLTGSSAGITGASWGDDDTIVFSQARGGGLWRVAAGGGTPTALTTLAPGQVNHAWPEMLPGSRAVLFTILNGLAESAQIAVLDLVSGEQRVLVPGGSSPRYARTGHIVYGTGGTLRAVPFDLKRLEVTGTPVPVLDQVITKDRVTPTQLGAADFALSLDGSLVYLSGNEGGGRQRTLVWVDRQGRETPIAAPPRTYSELRLSPDGTRVAVAALDEEFDIWIWDLSRTTLTRATFDPAPEAAPVWTPDGRRLLFSSQRSGTSNLYGQAADGTGAVERLTESPNRQVATAISPDGRRLIFSDDAENTSDDVMQMELAGARRASPLVQSRFDERGGIISPDGRWLAYMANDSGRFEVYVRPFPDVNSGHWQVSTAGGVRPLWARNGQELFYVAPGGAVMRVGVERNPSWVATTPTPVVKEGYFIRNAFGRTYDVSSDGQRFLMIKDGSGSDQAAKEPKVIVVQHWTEELKRLVPVK